MLRQPLVGQGLLIVEASRSHSDTPHSVGLLRTSDQPDAETSTWQHTIFSRERDIHATNGIRTRNPSWRATTDLRLRLRSHRDVSVHAYVSFIITGLQRQSANACPKAFRLWVRIPPGHGCLSLVNVVCCQVEVSESGRSLFQKNPIVCGVSEWDREASIMMRLWPRGRGEGKCRITYIRAGSS
jgi:hypothetical protein